MKEVEWKHFMVGMFVVIDNPWGLLVWFLIIVALVNSWGFNVSPLDK